jgi:hypothetical protein
MYSVAVNEEGRESVSRFSRLHTVIEVTDEAGDHYEVMKDCNTLLDGREINGFLQDYNSWSGAELKEDDLRNQFDMDEMVKGKSLVVEIGHPQNRFSGLLQVVPHLLLNIMGGDGIGDTIEEMTENLQDMSELEAKDARF